MKASLATDNCLIIFCVYLLVLSLFPLESRAADPEPVRSDGSIVNFTFDKQRDIEDWEAHGSGQYSIENGELFFQQSDGDNAVDTPDYQVSRNDEYVLQADFQVTKEAQIKVPFMIIGLLTDEGGGLAWRVNFRVSSDLGDQYAVGSNKPQQVEFEPKLEKGRTYTISIHVTPKNEARLFLFADSQITHHAYQGGAESSGKSGNTTSTRSRCRAGQFG